MYTYTEVKIVRNQNVYGGMFQRISTLWIIGKRRQTMYTRDGALINKSRGRGEILLRIFFPRLCGCWLFARSYFFLNSSVSYKKVTKKIYINYLYYLKEKKNNVYPTICFHTSILGTFRFTPCLFFINIPAIQTVLYKHSQIR